MSEGELIINSTENGAATEADIAQMEEMGKAANGGKKGERDD